MLDNETSVKSQAVQMLMHRTRMTEDDASYYADLSQLRIRNFLGLTESDPLDGYLFGIVDIATLMYQLDISLQHTEGSLGYKSESISEGGISKSVSTMTGSDVRAAYETEIENALENLKGDAGKVKFL